MRGVFPRHLLSSTRSLACRLTRSRDCEALNEVCRRRHDAAARLQTGIVYGPSLLEAPEVRLLGGLLDLSQEENPMKTLKKYKKLSTLLRIALKDLSKAERSKKYVVNMGQWHSPDLQGRCHVCLAGAVMANSLEVPIDRSASPEICRDELDSNGVSDAEKLYALNHVRSGDMVAALYNLSVDRIPADMPAQVDVVSYREDPKLWRRQMNNIIKLLKKYGE